MALFLAAHQFTELYGHNLAIRYNVYWECLGKVER
jgi:hypothetical protein